MSDLRGAKLDEYTVTASNHQWPFVNPPPSPTWECRLFPHYGNASPLLLQTDNPPNAFHRLMQRLILGFDWRPIKRSANG